VTLMGRSAQFMGLSWAGKYLRPGDSRWSGTRCADPETEQEKVNKSKLSKVSSGPLLIARSYLHPALLLGLAASSPRSRQDRKPQQVCSWVLESRAAGG
jgi:hypothetical protein